MDSAELEKLLRTESEQTQKLHDIVLKSVEERSFLSTKLSELDDHDASFGDRVSDKVAEFGGSWRFIGAFFGVMMLWIFGNAYLLSKPFDAYPFILLNLVLSTVAALQAPVIMMSQNRKESRDRQRGINDYLVNLKAELELRMLQEKVDLLITEQMATLFEIQKAQMDAIAEIKLGLDKLARSPGT